MAVIQAVGDEETWLLGDKHRQPCHNSEREIIKPRSLTNLIRFHAGIQLETMGKARIDAVDNASLRLTPKSGNMGWRLASGVWLGLETCHSDKWKTAPQQGGGKVNGRPRHKRN
ncbi:MAG: hypothetical protein IAF02_10170 [Anaerolineae bacterium]|nr:hypothetical protein [Anaerolineae bacterium]